MALRHGAIRLACVLLTASRRLAHGRPPNTENLLSERTRVPPSHSTAGVAEGLHHSVCCSFVVFTATTTNVKSSCCSASPIQSRIVSASPVEI